MTLRPYPDHLPPRDSLLALALLIPLLFALTSMPQPPKSDNQPPAATPPSYLTDPLEKLIQTVPDLATIRPAADQTPLSTILEKAGENVDDSLGPNFTDAKAKEFISEKEWKYSKKPNFWEVKPYDTFQPWQDQYTYYITHKNSFRRTDFLEYRLNKNGKASVPLGFFLSKGFASSVLYFSKSFQPESNFRYLGLATLDHQSAYVGRHLVTSS
jgi:hypothetical protein